MSTIPAGIEVDLEAERRAALDRHRRRIAPDLLEYRASQVVEAAAPATRRPHLERAARRLYSHQPDEVREAIVERALELAADPARPSRAGRPRKSMDPLRAKPRPRRGSAPAEASAPLEDPPARVLVTPPPSSEPAAAQAAESETRSREEPVIAPADEKQAKKPSPRPVGARSRLREPVRAIIGPMLETDPATTPTEAQKAVVAQGIKISRSVFIRIWTEYLQEHGLMTPELKKARMSRAITSGLARKAAEVEASEDSETSVPESDGRRSVEASVPPVPASGLPPGIHLVTSDEGVWRIVVDAPVAPAHAYSTLGAISMALDLARVEAA